MVENKLWNKWDNCEWRIENCNKRNMLKWHSKVNADEGIEQDARAKIMFLFISYINSELKKKTSVFVLRHCGLSHDVDFSLRLHQKMKKMKIENDIDKRIQIDLMFLLSAKWSEVQLRNNVFIEWSIRNDSNLNVTTNVFCSTLNDWQTCENNGLIKQYLHFISSFSSHLQSLPGIRCIVAIRNDWMKIEI